jgi:hypothetical protein
MAPSSVPKSETQPIKKAIPRALAALLVSLAAAAFFNERVTYTFECDEKGFGAFSVLAHAAAVCLVLMPIATAIAWAILGDAPPGWTRRWWVRWSLLWGLPGVAAAVIWRDAVLWSGGNDCRGRVSEITSGVLIGLAEKNAIIAIMFLLISTVGALGMESLWRFGSQRTARRG